MLNWIKSKVKKFNQIDFDELKALIIKGDSEKLKELIIGRKITSTNMKDQNEDESLLMVACNNDSIECLKLLVDYNVGFHINDNDFYSVLEPICAMCDRGNVEMLQYILEKGISDDVIHEIFRRCKDMMSNTEIFTVLVDHIKDIEYNPYSDGFLYAACYGSNINIVQKLLDRGEFAGSRYHDPLCAASEQGHTHIAELLLTLSKDKPVDRNRLERALIHSCHRGYVDFMKCLKAYGADADMFSDTLHLSVGGYQTEAVAWLLDNGADPNMSVSFGSTSLLTVVESSDANFETNLEILTLLLQHRADPNLADPYTGDAALMIAALANRIEYVRLLLEHGAGVSQVNEEGKSVLDMLSDEKYSEVLELCTQYIPKPVLK